MQQSDALDLLKMGKNVFLTGAAGSGKTYLLNQYIRYLKDHEVKVAITASTGIAATHLGGVTIHSWSGIGVRDQLTAQDIEKLYATPRVRRNYKNTRVLVIDEISMLHKQQLDMVDAVARYMLETNQPFGGMQVVVCGDFFQLPPVNSGPMALDKQFAFEADAWDSGDFQICYLHEQHRQGDDPLLAVLNDIRSGTAGEHTKVPLRTRYKKEPEGDTKPTKLYSRNVNVDAMNDQELKQLPGEEKIFTMKGQGWEPLVDGLKKNCLAPEQLRLKIGAEVMFVKNDVMGRYVNGTRGVVINFERNKGWPVVRGYDGDTIVAQPEDWEYEDNGAVRATITQVPLRLAWAITIHKSQGMTLDAAEMDLGDTFEPGMGYVALSRVRSLNGLKLLNLNEMALRVHPKILEQDLEFKERSAAVADYLQQLKEEEKTVRHHQTLLGRFAASNVRSTRSATVAEASSPKPPKPPKEPKESTYNVTLAMLKDQLTVDAIAEKRGLSLATILSHVERLRGQKQVDAEAIAYLKERLLAEDYNRIATALRQSEDGKLKTVYDKLEGKYSYSHLQMVRLLMVD